MNNFSNLQKSKAPPKAPAASHMLWFFIIPALVFMGWASWTLLSGLRAKPETSTILEKATKIKDAKSAGARYQAAYSLAQELQKIQYSKNLSDMSPHEEKLLFIELGSLLEKFPDDARLRRYLILTLAQLKDPKSIPIFEKTINDTDPDVRFYAAWGLIETLTKYPKERNKEHIDLFKDWLDDNDPAYKKISTSFLVHFPEHRAAIKELLHDENKEVQWNAAVALASQKDPAGKSLINEMLQLHTIRAVRFRSSQDLQQFVATAYEAALNLNDPDLKQAAAALKAKVPGENPEALAIKRGIGN